MVYGKRIHKRLSVFLFYFMRLYLLLYIVDVFFLDLSLVGLLNHSVSEAICRWDHHIVQLITNISLHHRILVISMHILFAPN